MPDNPIACPDLTLSPTSTKLPFSTKWTYCVKIPEFGSYVVIKLPYGFHWFPLPPDLYFSTTPTTNPFVEEQIVSFVLRSKSTAYLEKSELCV